MDVASQEQVTRALGRVSVWSPDLSPDLSATGDYEPLAAIDVPAYAAAICRRLGGAPPRVGESALVMGVSSRLWSLTVVPAARDGVLADPGGFVVREQDGAIVLGVTRAAGWTGVQADDVRRVVLDVLTPLVSRMTLSSRLLWGNVASSLYAVPRVHDLPQAQGLVEAIVDSPPLAGELDRLGDGTARRRTCCLFYEMPGAGLCGDCVLERAPDVSTRSARRRQVR